MRNLITLRYLIVLFAAFCIALGVACQGQAVAPVKTKPGAPLTITIEPKGEIARGEIGEFTVVATALTDSEHFSLDVALPKEIALYSGDLHQEGAVRAHTQFRLTFAVRVPEAGTHRITATARLRTGEAGDFEVGATYAIGEQTRASGADKGSSTRRGNDTVREYRLR